MKKKRARWLRLIILIAALVACLAAFFLASPVFWQSVGKNSPVQAAEQLFTGRQSPDAHFRAFVPYTPYQARESSEPEASQQAIPLAQPLPPVQPYSGKPRVAIVIDDVGLNAPGTLRAIALPSAITLSFLPYGADVAALSARAREAGHEILLHVPMEPLGREKPGPGALLVGLSAGETRARLEWAMGRFEGYDGVNNHMGSKFTADPERMSRFVDALRERHLFFLDSATNIKSVGVKVAREAGVPTESRDVFLDTTQTPEAVKAQLALVETVARRKGYVIAIGHPHAVTLEALEAWAREAERRGFVLVPVRELVR